MSKLIERDNYIDIRFIHTLKQQKLLMKERINYIYKLYNVNDTGELEILNKIFEQIDLIFNLCLKLNMTRSNNISINISERLNRIVNEESIYLEISNKIAALENND